MLIDGDSKETGDDTPTAVSGGTMSPTGFIPMSGREPSDTGPMLDAALSYAESGYRVLPLHAAPDGVCTCGRPDCQSPGKHPRNANGVTGASSDPAVITEWWRQWPNANIGLAMGQGIMAVDVDPRHGGDVSIIELQVKHGDLPPTATASTGGGGKHYFLKTKKKLKNSAGVLAEGVDIRSEGGFVVVAPSVHANGVAYAWDQGLNSIADAPGWIEQLAAAETKAPRPTAPGTIPEGQRNTVLFADAGAMRRRGLGEEAIFAALRADDRCVPRLSDAELRQIAVSVCRYAPEVHALHQPDPPDDFFDVPPLVEDGGREPGSDDDEPTVEEPVAGAANGNDVPSSAQRTDADSRARGSNPPPKAFITMLRFACAMARNDFSEDSIFAALRLDTRCDPPLEDAKLREIAHTAVAARDKQPKPKTFRELIAGLKTPRPKLPTGFTAIDERTRGGIRDICMLGAESGTGKTGMAMNIAMNIAKTVANNIASRGINVTVLQADEPIEDTVIRFGRMDKLDRYKLEGGDVAEVDAFLAKTPEDSPLSVFDGYDMTIDEAGVELLDRSGGGPMVEGGKPCVLVLDSLQEVRTDRTEDIELEMLQINDIIRTLKSLARRGVTILVTSELNRGAYRNTSGNNTRALAALKGSGKIEHAAHLLLVMRPFVNEEGSVDIEVAKNRLASGGKAKEPFAMHMNPDTTLFTDIKRSADSAQAAPIDDATKLRANKERVREVLRENPGVSGKSRLLELVPFMTRQPKLDAIDALKAGGEIRIEGGRTNPKWFLKAKDE
jgi:KaiC/GvpD/RAD55 family RecA-like ATPase